MTALTPQQKELQRFARSRAGQIRHGMRTYIETLGVIAIAYREQDHLTLGYESWDAYLAGEFDHGRLQLDPEMREKAIRELRLGGLSQRAIATTLGVGRRSVAEHFDDLQVAPGEPPAPVLGADGKTYSPARSPLVEAITGAIEDAQERAEAYAKADENGPGWSCEGAEYGVCGGEPHTDDCPASDHRADTPGEADVAASAPDEGEEQAPGSGTAAAGDLGGPPAAAPGFSDPAGSSAVTGEPAPDSPDGSANPPGPAESSSAGATGAGPIPAPVADPPPKWDAEERKAHEEEVQLRKDVESARSFAKTFVTQVRNQCFTILAGYRLGERHLVTAEQIADCRRALDQLEEEVLADAQ